VQAQQFYQRASLESNEKFKRKISLGTMKWWDEQDPIMRAEAFGGTVALDDMLSEFMIWCTTLCPPSFSLGDIQLWSRGAGFDCEILQHAFYEIFGHYPFDFRNHMCQRTIEVLMPEWLVEGVKNSHPNRGKHNALNDAIYQAGILDAALRNIRWGGVM
jgi:hypothetical protein